ncbi:hypothetical protein [Rhodopirellula sp. SWK7]|uniref:hypothetical protein n=1 Tax=Rhodopirellula sp. SWK7 TaxID=595460 RepID=UPI0005C76EF4|nr:hypothetical protein [Rhodopirellula sp. SWK7]
MLASIPVALARSGQFAEGVWNGAATGKYCDLEGVSSECSEMVRRWIADPMLASTGLSRTQCAAAQLRFLGVVMASVIASVDDIRFACGDMWAQ